MTPSLDASVAVLEMWLSTMLVGASALPLGENVGGDFIAVGMTFTPCCAEAGEPGSNRSGCARRVDPGNRWSRDASHDGVVPADRSLRFLGGGAESR